MGSPIIIDVSGKGYALTSAAAGVDFDINADGKAKRIGWAATGSRRCDLEPDVRSTTGVRNQMGILFQKEFRCHPLEGTNAPQSERVPIRIDERHAMSLGASPCTPAIALKVSAEQD